MLIEDRVRECFWLFGLTLPISKSYTEKLTLAFGSDVAKAIPEMMGIVEKLCMNNKEDFDGYLTFIEESIDYMRGYRDNLPQVELPYEEYQEYMHKSLEKHKKELDSS